MKKTGFILLSLFAQTAFCQNSYTKFIEKSSVKWAASLSDTCHFTNPNLSLLLREKFNNGSIKAGLFEGGFNEKLKKKLAKETIINRIAPNRVTQIADDAGNITGTTIEAENPLLSSKYFDSETNDLVEVQQILYIQSGKLKSHTPWVSPKYAVFTSWGQKLGIANAFSTGFNTSRCMAVSTKKKAVLLGNRFTMIPLDSAQHPGIIKQLYGYNLLQALWPYLHKKNYKIYRIDSSRLIPFSMITRSLIDNQQLNIPLYDAEGNLSNKTVVQEDFPLNPSDFSAMELVQEWHYHSKKNRIFNNISHIILYARKWRNGQQEAVASPILKIMLK